MHDLLKSPKLRGTLATVAGTAGYAVLGTAGYKSGVDTTAGMDAEQVRTVFSVAIAVAGYILPTGCLSVVRNWANILGKQSAERLTALEARVAALEAKPKIVEAAK